MERYKEAISIARSSASMLKERNKTIRSSINRELEAVAVQGGQDRLASAGRVAELNSVLGFLKRCYKNGFLDDQVTTLAINLDTAEKDIETLDRQIDAQVALIHDSIFRSGRGGLVASRIGRETTKARVCKLLAFIQQERDAEKLREEHLPRLQGLVGDIQESGFIKLAELFLKWNTQLEEYDRCSQEFQDFYSNICKALEYKPQFEMPKPQDQTVSDLLGMPKPQDQTVVEGPGMSMPSDEAVMERLIEVESAAVKEARAGPPGTQSFMVMMLAGTGSEKTPIVTVTAQELLELKDFAFSLVKFCAIRAGAKIGVKRCCAEFAAFKLCGESSFGLMKSHKKQDVNRLAEAIQNEIPRNGIKEDEKAMMNLLILNAVNIYKQIKRSMPQDMMKKRDESIQKLLYEVKRAKDQATQTESGQMKVYSASDMLLARMLAYSLKGKALTKHPGKYFFAELAGDYLTVYGMDPAEDSVGHGLEDPGKILVLNPLVGARHMFYTREEAEGMLSRFSMPSSYMKMIPEMNFALEDARLAKPVRSLSTEEILLYLGKMKILR